MTDFNTLLNDNCFSDDPEVQRAAASELEHNFGAEIMCQDMAHSVQFAHHAKGCIIAAAKLSENVVIYQNVTIGSNMKFNKLTQEWEKMGNPVIGKNVVIADGAKILGPVIIGDNTVIGANAMITKDVPANSVAFGVNQVKPKDPNYDLIFHMPMPTPADVIAASQTLIDRYNAQEH
ncbi:serine acetyltransferase [Secundilactobacillus paracollinoides]|uniref:serine acetyltransferase n=1 Tax=Secundilactobacillus paracollinoides TaxID=240427 RepID=UPI00081AA17D|nr:serine acetyltransferase [Secundilactobacillus paracollinoides]ANZ63578.1 serine acetyltransferase [Secundilactobacillus paracollinoides]